MNLFKFISSIAFIAFIFFSLFDFQQRRKETKHIYYLCQDNHTRQFLIPLTPYQYKNLIENYVDFTSMYLCNERRYTRYHLELIKNK
jgi:hypothetical protein